MSKKLVKILNRTLMILGVVLVFSVSFFMGHRTALRDNERQLSSAIDEAERAAAVLPLLAPTEPEELEASAKGEEEPLVRVAAPDEEVEPEAEEPPCPILSPTDGTVSNSYTLQSVYSETTRDWRAHTGIDIEAPLAAAVIATAEGTVTAAYNDSLWGNVIEITHKGGLRSIYKGVSTLDMVSVGQSVQGGDIISGVGTSPIESKAMSHLHFETWQDDVCVNPDCYVF